MNFMGGNKIMEFKFKKVDSEELLKEIYRVRYEVYCEECGFLPAGDYPNGLEIDQFDEHSIHFAAFADDAVIGTCRLVKYSVHGYPLNEHCKAISVRRTIEIAFPSDSFPDVSLPYHERCGSLLFQFPIELRHRHRSLLRFLCGGLWLIRSIDDRYYPAICQGVF